MGSRAYTLASAVVALSLLEIARRIHRLRRRAPLLEAQAVEFPATSILVPARNEEANIGDCVASLRQQGDSCSVVVIDDGSTDRTAAIVEEIAAEDQRVELIAAGELPPNWRGKVHALAVGLSQVETPWVLLTDADTRHAPGLLAKAHATASRRGLDSLSLTGFQEVRGLGENLLTPLVFAVLDGLLGDWVRAAKGEMAVANGQYILVRRDALLAIGGFEAIRLVPIDDVALAAKLHAAGFRIGFFRAPAELKIRMYRGFRESVKGWRRNLGALLGDKRLQATCILAILFGPAALLGIALLKRNGWAALELWLAGSLASAVLRRGSGHSAAFGLLYPDDALVAGTTIVLSLLDYRRGSFTSWRGRTMPVGR